MLDSKRAELPRHEGNPNLPQGSPLSHLRVLEIGSLPAAAYCARLLADLGAEVVKLEPLGGDPTRRLPPSIGGDSAWFGFLNYGKTSAIGDPAALMAAANVCIDSRPKLDNALARSPGLVHVDLSWFGRSGPYAGYAGTDAVCRALAGLVQLVGPVEGPPVAGPDYQAAIIGGLSACIGVLGCLLGQADGDAGRTLELSVQEACIALAEYQASEVVIAGWQDQRLGLNRFQPTFPLGIYPAKDDWVGVTLVTPAQWRDFCLLVGLPELAEAPGLTLGAERLPRAAELEAAIMPKLRERTAAEWFALGLQHRLPIVPVPDMAHILAHEAFHTRGAVVPITFGGTVAYGPGAPFGLTHTPARQGGAVPPVPSEPAAFRLRPPADPVGPPRGPGLPLRDLRVVDLTMGWAGPLATRTLADLGADVIKVEACQYPDWWRGVDNRPAALEAMRHEKTGRFVVMNRNKRGITLDLTTPEGVEIVRRLVADADLVVENYSSGVLPKLGLSYDHLRQVNPSLVMASMSAFGATGPWKECRAYGSTLEHGSGLPRLVGEPGAPPTMSHLAYGDANGGLNATVALLAALLHRKRTGEGQWIDLSQVECMLPFTAVAMMVQSVTGATPERTGNRHPGQAPHGVFPCAGQDRWVLVAVAEDAHWPRLCEAIGRPDLLADPSLRTLAGRQAKEHMLEDALAAWTRQRDPADAMAALQAQGVPAGAVISPGVLHDDPHLVARRFWQWRERAVVGSHPQASLPFRETGEPYPVRWPSPTLGEHTQEVLRDRLRMPAAEIAALAASGVIGTTPIPARRRVTQPA